MKFQFTEGGGQDGAIRGSKDEPVFEPTDILVDAKGIND